MLDRCGLLVYDAYMPELPEVQTTVNGLNKTIIGLKIVDVWSIYDSHYFKGSKTIKDRVYFKEFLKSVVGKVVHSATRRAKNVLIHLGRSADGKQIKKEPSSTILVHMKMTGHLLYGKYRFDPKFKKDPWIPLEPEALKDPYNRHVRFVISFSNGYQLALSDVRKFAKVALIEHEDMRGLHTSSHLEKIGPEPLDDNFTFTKFLERISLHPKAKIKQVLLDQEIIAGIGNIYADESLWLAGIHPATKVEDLYEHRKAKWLGPRSGPKPAPVLKLLFKAIKDSLAKGVSFGGDSMSDYRNVYGEKGEFQNKHHAYQKVGMKCDKKGCGGTIVRIKLGGRGTHFCDKHQRL